MKNARAWMTVMLCGALCALSACSSGSSFVRPGYDFKSVGKVAVLVTMNVGNPAQQQEIADLFAMQVLQKGYDVIDRANISALSQEAEFQNASGITSPEGRAKLAIHNVSAVIIVSVAAPYAYQVPPSSQSYWVRGHWYWSGPGYVWVPGHWEVRERPGYMAESGEDISVTAKMVDVQTGTLLWAGEGTGSLKSGLSTLGGALVGAGAGVALGSAVGNTRGGVIGGIAGALAGGVAGAALQPDLAQLMRSVIEKTCRGLPARPVSQAYAPAPIAATGAGMPAAAPGPTIAQTTPASEPAAAQAGWEPAWPLSAKEGALTLTMYQPKIQKWSDNAMSCQAVVSTQAAQGEPVYGVMTFTVGAERDQAARAVTLRDFHITDLVFGPGSGTDAATRQELSKLLPAGAKTIPLDQLRTTFALSEAVSAQIAPVAVSAGPRILFTTTPTILVRVDGEPVLAPMADLNVERVVNTRALIAKAGGQFYLMAMNLWYEAPAIEGPWGMIDNPPALLEKAKEAAVAANMVDLMQPQPGVAPLKTAPAVRVSTVPTELIETDGPPQLLPVEDTNLLQVKNTDDVIFLDLKTNRYYVLLSDRWFASKSLYGPWAAVAAGDLPADLAKMPAQAVNATQPPPVASTQPAAPALQPTAPAAQPAPPVAVAPYEPPPPPVEVVPPSPGADYYWTDGYWDWGPAGWIWIGGRWTFGIGPIRGWIGPGHFWGGWGHGRGHWR